MTITCFHQKKNCTKGYAIIFKSYIKQLQNWQVNQPSRDEYTKFIAVNLVCSQMVWFYPYGCRLNNVFQLLLENTLFPSEWSIYFHVIWVTQRYMLKFEILFLHSLSVLLVQDLNAVCQLHKGKNKNKKGLFTWFTINQNLFASLLKRFRQHFLSCYCKKNIYTYSLFA